MRKPVRTENDEFSAEHYKTERGKIMALEIGNGWDKTSQKGKQYVSLNIKKEAAPLIESGNYYFMMCKISNKSSTDAPDYSVFATLKEENKNTREPVRAGNGEFSAEHYESTGTKAQNSGITTYQ